MSKSAVPPALAAVCLMVLSCASTAAITPTVTTIMEPVEIPFATIIYYDITGSTEAELRAQLDALGPIGYDQFKGDATTEWFIHWTWPGYGDTSCDLDAATTSLDMKVILPRWSPPGDASSGLENQWSNYVNLLAQHEKGHVEYVLENFPSVLEAIQNATCDNADAAATAILEKLRQHDIDYDVSTQHGATQGATFP